MLRRLVCTTLCYRIGMVRPVASTAAKRFIHSPEVSRRELLRALRYPCNAGQHDTAIETVEQFLEGAKEGKAGGGDACALLQRSYNGLQKLELERQRAGAAKLGAGRILSWLWGNDQSLWNDVLDRDFADLLCWHLEADGKDKFVHEWLLTMSPARNKGPSTAQDRDKFHMESAWMAEAQAGLVKAKLYWNSTAEAAIIACAAPLHKESQYTYVVPSTVVLDRVLNTPFARPVSQSAFQMYLYLSDFRSTARARAAREKATVSLDISSRMLYHPTDPQADDILQIYQSKAFIEAVKTWRVQARAEQVRTLTRAIYILLLQGRSEDARTLGVIASPLDSLSFAYRFENYREYREDPKLEQVHRDSPFVQQVWDEILDEEKRSAQPQPKSRARTRPYRKPPPNHQVFRPN